MTMDVTKAIEPKSDQLNADCLMTGPRTIKIRDVKIHNTAEQPVWVYFDGDNNKPWKTSKTSTRTLAAIWGPDAAKWIGMSCTIYCDPEVTWGGMKVGGIRVSHMEGLTAPRTLMLTKARGKKGATVIKPLDINRRENNPEPDPITPPDTEEILSQARKAASGGKSEFASWWKANPESRPIANGIIDELKALAADADADSGAM